MLQLILMVAGIVWALRKPGLRKLTPAQYPAVPEPVFHEWKTLEMQSINMFLWATWGMFLVSIPVTLIALAAFPSAKAVINIAIFVMVLAALVFAERYGRKVSKFKKQHGIQWPAQR